MAQTISTLILLALVVTLLSSLSAMTSMDHHRFPYSMKNVPIPSEKEYKLEFLNSIHKLSIRMKWRAFFFLEPNSAKNTKNTFKFNTSKAPPNKYNKELKYFLDGLCDLAKNLKFRKIREQFQNTLNEDLKNMKSETKVVIAADKTRNHYKMEKEKYQEYLENNITKDYKKAEKNVVKNITKDDQKVAAKLEIDDRVHVTSKRDSYITVKDHKPGFMNNPKFRLINPTKAELGMVSKQMLEQIIQAVKTKTQLLQWKNPDSVINWFTNLKNKDKLLFIQFDVVDFYGSISQVLVKNSLTFAARHIPISEDEKVTILQATNSFLFSKNQEWIKKNGGTFDITMGGYHGAEICELVGIFLLSQLTDIIPAPYIGLYRDDGLAVSSGTPRQIEIMKKKICQVFNNNGLKITTEANAKCVNFLDITLDLRTGTYKPFMKENDNPIYVHTKSNHPPGMLQNIPVGVNRRLSKNSSSKEIFDAAAPPYQEALNKSGYKHTLQFEPPETHCTKKKKKNRKRCVCWFNPPFSLNVKTNVGKEFLKLLDRSFPPSNPLVKNV